MQEKEEERKLRWEVEKLRVRRAVGDWSGAQGRWERIRIGREDLRGLREEVDRWWAKREEAAEQERMEETRRMEGEDSGRERRWRDAERRWAEEIERAQARR